MPPVVVRHALGSYPVYIESGGLARLAPLTSEHLPRSRLVLIADETVAGLYDQWAGDVAPHFAARLTFPPGERSKTRARWQQLTDDLLSAALGRDTAVVAMGGGVTLDLAGFVAATYQRGIPHVQVPTTLLAMVDAAVGGKVGVDTPLGKNLVGAFHPPALVLVDPLTLVTLPEAEYRMGLAEAVKHGLVADAEYLGWLGAETRRILGRDPAALIHLVRRSVEIKASIVAEDERELGRRAVLNAGHTVGHALERVSEYQLAHGEAVAIGLAVECRIAERLGLLDPDTGITVRGTLQRLGLPVGIPGRLPRPAILDAMRQDKKNRGGEIRMALPEAAGRMATAGGQWTRAVDPQLILTCLDPKETHIST